ncbi:hypothetical protein C8Q76DRAFT_617367, partial [Earliella scabrosa]
MEPRGVFSSHLHSQYHTHVLRRRTLWIVPVILGDKIPRSDRGDDEKNAWARMMSILFVPWRDPVDLKAPDETWLMAYERHLPSISARNAQIISNMNVLAECRDVRDAHTAARR